MNLHRTKTTAGFTLVELLVVIAIIGILSGIIFPAVQAVRNSARKTKCSNNIRQIAMAVRNYESSQGKFPAGDQGNGASFFVTILADLEEEFLYELSYEPLTSGDREFSNPVWQDRLVQLSETQVPTFLCPATNLIAADVADHGGNTSFTVHYAGNGGPVGASNFQDQSGRNYSYTYDELFRDPSAMTGPPAKGSLSLEGLFSPDQNGEFEGLESTQIRDNSSRTIMLGEVSKIGLASGTRQGWAFGMRYESDGFPRTMYCAKSVSDASIINDVSGLGSADSNLISFSSEHSGGANFAMLDGSTHFITQLVDQQVYKTYFSVSKTEKPMQLQENLN